jgi:hypothetical protein
MSNSSVENASLFDEALFAASSVEKAFVFLNLFVLSLLIC